MYSIYFTPPFVCVCVCVCACVRACVCVLCGSVLVMLYCVSQASGWSLSCLTVSVEPEDFLVSVGVIIFSYTSQVFLPPIEGSMEHRGQFTSMLCWTHAAACVMKTSFALLVKAAPFCYVFRISGYQTFSRSVNLVWQGSYGSCHALVPGGKK